MSFLKNFFELEADQKYEIVQRRKLINKDMGITDYSPDGWHHMSDIASRMENQDGIFLYSLNLDERFIYNLFGTVNILDDTLKYSDNILTYRDSRDYIKNKNILHSFL